MEVLKNEKAQPNARQLAGIVFKNTIHNSTKDENLENLWGRMNDTQRDLLKNNSLIALNSPDRGVIRAAGNALASI